MRKIGLIVFVALVAAWVSIGQFYQYQTNYGRYGRDDHENYNVPQAEDTNERIARYTGWLAGLTAVLSGSTLLLWWVTRKSAKIAERALTELEAPAIFVEVVESGLKPSAYFPGGKLDVSAARPSLHASEIKYRFINYGRTPARIVAVADSFEPMKKGSGAPPPIDVVTRLTDEMPWGVVIPPNGGFSDMFTVNILPRTFGDKQDLFYNPDRAAMFFSVAIRYADIFENRFVVGNCFLFDAHRPPDGGWILAKYGHPYSYRLREKKAS